MLIGVMSDSHDNMSNVEKAFSIFKENNVNVVIHLGDIISPFVVRKMISLSWDNLMVYAVYGNNDGDKLLLYKLFREKGWVISEQPSIYELGRTRILVLHGFGTVNHTKEVVYSLARDVNAEIILYGHTHQKDYKRIANKKIIVNPGEVYGYLTGTPTIAIIDTDTFEAEFVELK